MLALLTVLVGLSMLSLPSPVVNFSRAFFVQIPRSFILYVKIFAQNDGNRLLQICRQ